MHQYPRYTEEMNSTDQHPLVSNRFSLDRMSREEDFKCMRRQVLTLQDGANVLTEVHSHKGTGLSRGSVSLIEKDQDGSFIHRLTLKGEHPTLSECLLYVDNTAAYLCETYTYDLGALYPLLDNMENREDEITPQSPIE